MKTILALLKAGQNVFIGGHEIIAYSDGTLGCRLADSLSYGSSERATMKGLRRILKWMDDELANKSTNNNNNEQTIHRHLHRNAQ